MEIKLKEYLEKYNIEYKVHKHPAVFTVAESNKLNLNIPALHTKNLFLKDENGKYYLVCLPGEKRLNIKLLEKHFKLKKLKFASSEELKRELSLTPGSVSIFGMIHSSTVHLILDEEVFSAKTVGFHPNINTATLELNHENFERFYNSLKSPKEIIPL